MKRVVIIEGVTGAGKSSVIAQLRAGGARVGVVDEDETLGDMMDHSRDPSWRSSPRFPSLERVLAGLEAGRPGGAGSELDLVLVERFHLTAYALLPRWSPLRGFDERLARLGAVHVLLTYPPALAEERSLLRPDRDEWAAGMDEWYGSRRGALSAVLVSQRRRWRGLERSLLPFLHLDTRERDWALYAETILTFCLSGGRRPWT